MKSLLFDKRVLVLIGTAVIAVFPVVLESRAGIPPVAFPAFLFAMTVAVFLLLVLIYVRLRDGLSSGESRLDRFTPKLSAKSVILFAAIIFVIWVPYLVAFAPGTMGYDTVAQIKMFYPSNDSVQLIQSVEESRVPYHMSDHHPIFDTIVFGLFAYASDCLTGSWNAGLVIYIVMQAAAMALVFSVVCAYLRRLAVPAWLRLGSLLFFGFLPVFPMNAVTVIKDTLFSWVLVVFFLLVVEVSVSKGGALSSRRFVVLMILVSLLVCLTKKTGVYVVAVTYAGLLVANQGRWKPLTIALGSCALTIWIVLPLLVFPALNVVKGGSQEALGPIIQQTGAYVIRHDGEIDDDDIRVIDAVIPFDGIEDAYDQTCYDGLKYTYRWDSVTPSDLISFVGVWARFGVLDPISYFWATEKVIGPYFSIDKKPNLYYETGAHYDDRASFMLGDEPRGVFRSIVDFLSSIPLLGLLLCDAFYGWLLPVIAVGLILCSGKSKSLMPPMLLIIMLMVSYLIAPIAWTRYLFPLYYVAPIILGLCCYAYRSVSIRLESTLGG